MPYILVPAITAGGSLGLRWLLTCMLQGDREITVAAEESFNVPHTLHSARVTGRDRRGLGAELTPRLEDAGINLRGFTASVIGTQIVAYAAVDPLEDVKRVMESLKNA